METGVTFRSKSELIVENLFSSRQVAKLLQTSSCCISTTSSVSCHEVKFVLWSIVFRWLTFTFYIPTKMEIRSRGVSRCMWSPAGIYRTVWDEKKSASLPPHFFTVEFANTVIQNNVAKNWIKWYIIIFERQTRFSAVRKEVQPALLPVPAGRRLFFFFPPGSSRSLPGFLAITNPFLLITFPTSHTVCALVMNARALCF